MTIFNYKSPELLDLIAERIHGIKPFHGVFVNPKNLDDKNQFDRMARRDSDPCLLQRYLKHTSVQAHLKKSGEHAATQESGTMCIIISLAALDDCYGCEMEMFQIDDYQCFGVDADRNLYYLDGRANAIYLFRNDSLLFEIQNDINRLLIKEIEFLKKKLDIPIVPSNGGLTSDEIPMKISSGYYPIEYPLGYLDKYDPDNITNKMFDVTPIHLLEDEHCLFGEGEIYGTDTSWNDAACQEINQLYGAANTREENGHFGFVLRINNRSNDGRHLSELMVVACVFISVVKRTGYIVRADVRPDFADTNFINRLVKTAIAKVYERKPKFDVIYFSTSDDDVVDQFEQMGFSKPRSITTPNRVRGLCGNGNYVLEYRNFPFKN